MSIPSDDGKWCPKAIHHITHQAPRLCSDSIGTRLSAYAVLATWTATLQIPVWAERHEDAVPERLLQVSRSPQLEVGVGVGVVAGVGLVVGLTIGVGEGCGVGCGFCWGVS